MLGAPSCVLGAVKAPLEPLALWLKFPLTPGIFFFFGFLGNDSLNHSVCSNGGEVGGYSLEGCWEGWGANRLPEGKLSAAQVSAAVG